MAPFCTNLSHDIALQHAFSTDNFVVIVLENGKCIYLILKHVLTLGDFPPHHVNYFRIFLVFKLKQSRYILILFIIYF